jgi:hypothetical protein
LSAFIGLAMASGPSVAQMTVSESFTGGSNVGGWTYGAPVQVIESSGGNPGAYFHAIGLDTFAPMPRTAFNADNVFHGNFRLREVTSIGVDLITLGVDFSAADRPLSIMLVSDNNTPGNFNDDWAAYRVGAVDVPIPGEGWRHFDFAVPSQSMTLPAGWNTQAFGPGSPANPNWNDVITDVDQVRFFYGDPEFLFIFQVWNVGLDNPSITTVPEPAVVAVLAIGALAVLPRRKAGLRSGHATGAPPVD